MNSERRKEEEEDDKMEGVGEGETTQSGREGKHTTAHSSLPGRRFASWQFGCRRPHRMPLDAQSVCVQAITTMSSHAYNSMGVNPALHHHSPYQSKGRLVGEVER